MKVPFNDSELIALLECARVAVAHKSTFRAMAAALDLSDESMLDLRDKLRAFMEKDKGREVAARREEKTTAHKTAMHDVIEKDLDALGVPSRLARVAPHAEDKGLTLIGRVRLAIKLASDGDLDIENSVVFTPEFLEAIRLRFHKTTGRTS